MAEQLHLRHTHMTIMVECTPIKSERKGKVYAYKRAVHGTIHFLRLTGTRSRRTAIDPPWLLFAPFEDTVSGLEIGN